jgi:hypothetical protein
MKAIQKEIGDAEGMDDFAAIDDKIKKTKLPPEMSPMLAEIGATSADERDRPEPQQVGPSGALGLVDASNCAAVLEDLVSPRCTVYRSSLCSLALAWYSAAMLSRRCLISGLPAISASCRY